MLCDKTLTIHVKSMGDVARATPGNMQLLERVNCHYQEFRVLLSLQASIQQRKALCCRGFVVVST
jgi:hypothetical protein